MPKNKRRLILARGLGAAAAWTLAGCDRLSRSEWFPPILQAGERLSDSAQHLVTSRQSMAQEFSEADLSPEFRSNGTARPNDAQYQALAAGGFKDYRLQVGGLVERSAAFSLAELRALPSRTQITRHDCVEGWSAIGKWKGVQLSRVLERVRPSAGARYAVFRCADALEEGGVKYYESVDLEDAYHPQTILAYELNGQALPMANGAPIRVRIERQLGYKMAKYIMGIELVASYDRIGGGKGGYWEDLGYQWYAGI